MKWEKVKLGEIVNNLDSRRKPLNDSERAEITQLGLYPYIGANNIMGYVDQFLFDEEILCVAEDGGSWGAGQRCAVIYKGKTWVNNHAHVLSAKTMLDLRYLMHYLNYSDLTKFISGSTRGKLTKGSLEKIEIPLPPLHIQQQIADTLDKADLLRKKDQELLQKYDQLAQAIFYDMFGDPVKNEKGWEEKQLDELIYPDDKISYGIVQPGDEDPQGVPVVRVGDFDNMVIKSHQVKRVSKSTEALYKKTRLIGDEILIACVGSIGKIALVDSTQAGFNIVRATARVRPNHTLVNRFFLASLLTTSRIQEYFIKETRTVSQPTLNISHIASTKIILPPIRLQETFSSVYNNLQIQKHFLVTQTNRGLFDVILNDCFKSAL